MATGKQMRLLYSLKQTPYSVSEGLSVGAASALISQYLSEYRSKQLSRPTKVKSSKRGSFWKSVGEGRGDYETDHYIGMEPF